uniref:Uncharacterized protein n=1 Tax=Timema cristinae TaxID=61476 RepID=A0A7R9CJT9_TIMCR|nr:unnamed protein product [Timema cristinae]
METGNQLMLIWAEQGRLLNLNMLKLDHLIWSHSPNVDHLLLEEEVAQHDEECMYRVVERSKRLKQQVTTLSEEKSSRGPVQKIQNIIYDVGMVEFLQKKRKSLLGQLRGYFSENFLPYGFNNFIINLPVAAGTGSGKEEDTELDSELLLGHPQAMSLMRLLGGQTISKALQQVSQGVLAGAVTLGARRKVSGVESVEGSGAGDAGRERSATGDLVRAQCNHEVKWYSPEEEKILVPGTSITPSCAASRKASGFDVMCSLNQSFARTYLVSVVRVFLVHRGILVARRWPLLTSSLLINGHADSNVASFTPDEEVEAQIPVGPNSEINPTACTHKQTTIDSSNSIVELGEHEVFLNYSDIVDLFFSVGNIQPETISGTAPLKSNAPDLPAPCGKIVNRCAGLWKRPRLVGVSDRPALMRLLRLITEPEWSREHNVLQLLWRACYMVLLALSKRRVVPHPTKCHMVTVGMPLYTHKQLSAISRNM